MFQMRVSVVKPEAGVNGAEMSYLDVLLDGAFQEEVVPFGGALRAGGANGVQRVVGVRPVPHHGLGGGGERRSER